MVIADLKLQNINKTQIDEFACIGSLGCRWETLYLDNESTGFLFVQAITPGGT